MSIERHVLEPAYVLHLQAYRETSALVNLITREQGRIAVVARGVRRARSDTRILLQPFTPLLVSWSTRGELGTLTGVERARAMAPPVADALMSGMYLNELLMRLTHRFDPQPELFDHYSRAIDALARMGPHRGGAMEELLRHFEKGLLANLGYGLQLTRDAGNGALVRSQWLYSYRVQHGPVHSVGRARDHPGGVTVHGHTLLALARGTALSPLELAEAKRLMRAEVDSHLGSRPLASRSLFKVRRPRPASERE